MDSSNANNVVEDNMDDGSNFTGVSAIGMDVLDEINEKMQKMEVKNSANLY